MKRKFAFTLSEVLITLGVVGVVAVLTIPGVMKNYQNNQNQNNQKNKNCGNKNCGNKNYGNKNENNENHSYNHGGNND